MDSMVTERPQADERFDTARVTAEVDALASKHEGREDVFLAVRSVHQLASRQWSDQRFVAV